MLPQTVFIPLVQTAKILGLPRDWLTREAEAGRIPHIVIGRQMYFNWKVVAECIITRMKQNANVVEEYLPLVDEAGNLLPSGMQMPAKMPMNYDMPPMRAEGERSASEG